MKLKVLLVILFIPALLASQNIQTDRSPAVAGQFYPSDPAELRAMLKSAFSSAVQPRGFKDVVALIVPHAGYVYSGVVAASGYNQIDP